MNTIEDIVNGWLKSEQFTQRSLLSDESQEIQELTPDLQDEREIVGLLEITSTFGFIPTFDNKGNVSIYARFGGPERILYTPNLFGNFGTKKFINRFGKGATPFVNDTNEGSLLYAEDLATERYNLQDVVLELEEHTARSISSLNHMYPLRVQFLPVSDTNKSPSLDFQFKNPKSSNTSYASLFKSADDVAKTNFVIYLLQSCASYLSSVPNDGSLNILLNTIMSKEALQNLVTTFQTYFVREFMETLELRGARLYAKSFMSGVGHDWQFKQFINQVKKDIPGKSTNQILSFIKESLLQPIEISSAVAKSVQGFFEGLSIPTAADAAIKQQLEDAKTNLDASRKANIDSEAQHKTNIEALEQKLKTQAEDFERQNRFELSMLGAAAGVGAAYYTLYKDKPDLENWERGAILAIGGLLGSIPYLNLVSIAATPILIEKGIEFKKNRS